MMPTFTRLAAWSSYPRMSMQAFRARFPALPDQDAGPGEDDGKDGALEVVLITGNLRLTQQQYLGIVRHATRRVAVDGHLQVEGRVGEVFFVSGDLYCHCAHLSASWRSDAVRGRILACDCVHLSAGQRITTRQGPACRIRTRFLFSWGFRLDRVDLNPDAVVFLLIDWDDAHNCELPNPVVAWHDTVHVLAVEFTAEVFSIDCDQPSWDIEHIASSLRKGESIYRSGFDIACYPIQRAADDALSVGDARLAYALYRQSAAISPSYSLAWQGMGNALWYEGAIDQALEAYTRASETFPEEQCALLNDAAVMAGRCALVLRRLALAEAMSTRALEHVAGNWSTVSGTAPAYCVRAEAHLQGGDLDAAEADLALALEDDRHDATALGLTGLVHYLRGEHDTARRFEADAAGIDDDMAVGYDEHTDTAFLAAEPCHVDWDRSNPETGPVPTPLRDEAYWRHFMACNETIKIRRVPPEFRTAALLQDMLEARTEDDENGRQGDWLRFLGSFPAAAFTPALAQAVVALGPCNLASVPRALVDKAVCLQARAGLLGFRLAHVPQAVIDYEVCLRAVACGESLASVPPALVDKALCLAAIKCRPAALDEVPGALVDDDLIAAAIAFGSPWHLENAMPSMYLSAPLLAHAVSRHKEALDAISGSRFDAALYQHARQCYGRDADWDQIVARHAPATFMVASTTRCAHACWSVFWDEAFILGQVAQASCGLSAWEIPDACFTQAIADGCAQRDRIHLDKIPLRFVHQAMCDAFSGEYPRMLGHVPVAYRSAAICAAAVGKDPANLALVPLALRSVELCVAALRASAEVECQVPSCVHRAVFDRLIARHASEFEPGFLYLSRAERAVCRTPPEIDLALADCATVRALRADDGITRDDKAHARYVQGYGHHLRGEAAGAARLHPGGDWPAYADCRFDEPAEPVDFNKGKFDTLMHDLDRLTQAGHYRRALAAVAAGERMLAEAGSRDPYCWAHVLDKKRFLAYELGDWDLNEAACHQAIARLQHEDLWLFGAFTEPLRAALRSAYFRLGTMHAGADRSALELKEDLKLVDQALALFYPDEDDDVIAPFREGRAVLRALLDAHMV